MHYGDEFQQRENFLSVVIYIHDDLTSPGKKDLQLTSISACKYKRPWFVHAIIQSANDVLMKFEKIEKLKSETWYMIDLHEVQEELQIISITDVSSVESESFRLH